MALREGIAQALQEHRVYGFSNNGKWVRCMCEWRGTIYDHPDHQAKYIMALINLLTCIKCGRIKGCSGDCEDMNCVHCYCHRDGRDG